MGDEGKSGKLRGSQSQVSGVGVGKIRRAQKVEEEARRAISAREHGEKLPLQTAALLERVQQARQGKKNQGVIEAEIVARPVRERHGEREGGETPRMIVDRKASEARHSPPGRDWEREYDHQNAGDHDIGRPSDRLPANWSIPPGFSKAPPSNVG